MIPSIFLIMVLVFIFLVVSFMAKIYALGMMSAMGIMIVGVYILSFGAGDINNFLTMTIGIINICLGAFIFIGGTIQEYVEVF